MRLYCEEYLHDFQNKNLFFFFFFNEPIEIQQKYQMLSKHKQIKNGWNNELITKCLNK